MKGLSNGSLPFGALWGVQLKIHVIYLGWIAYRLLTAEGGRVGDEALVQAVLFVSVLLHELGHCAGARWVGGDAKEVVLWPLGGLAAIRHPASPKGEFVSTSAGPAMNLVLFLGAAALLMLLPQSRGFFENGLNPYDETGLVLFLEALLGMNLVLFAFNVLPAFPLDGGKIFRSLLWAIPPVTWRGATLAVAVVAMVFGLVFVGLAPLMPNGGATLFFALVGSFVVVSSFAEFQKARAHRSLPTVPDDRMPHER